MLLDKYVPILHLECDDKCAFSQGHLLQKYNTAEKRFVIHSI